jgi:hypothetical protein
MSHHPAGRFARETRVRLRSPAEVAHFAWRMWSNQGGQGVATMMSTPVGPPRSARSCGAHLDARREDPSCALRSTSWVARGREIALFARICHASFAGRPARTSDARLLPVPPPSNPGLRVSALLRDSRCSVGRTNAQLSLRSRFRRQVAMQGRGRRVRGGKDSRRSGSGASRRRPRVARTAFERARVERQRRVNGSRPSCVTGGAVPGQRGVRFARLKLDERGVSVFARRVRDRGADERRFRPVYWPRVVSIRGCDWKSNCVSGLAGAGGDDAAEPGFLSVPLFSSIRRDARRVYAISGNQL